MMGKKVSIIQWYRFFLPFFSFIFGLYLSLPPYLFFYILSLTPIPPKKAFLHPPQTIFLLLIFSLLYFSMFSSLLFTLTYPVFPILLLSSFPLNYSLILLHSLSSTHPITYITSFPILSSSILPYPHPSPLIFLHFPLTFIPTPLTPFQFSLPFPYLPFPISTHYYPLLLHLSLPLPYLPFLISTHPYPLPSPLPFPGLMKLPVGRSCDGCQIF